MNKIAWILLYIILMLPVWANAAEPKSLEERLLEIQINILQKKIIKLKKNADSCWYTLDQCIRVNHQLENNLIICDQWLNKQL